MFPEFGQNPLCLDLDLDSYEGAWNHVAAFRNRAGWLMAARATIQSEQDMMCAVLLAACDDHDNPIPAWRAEHLVNCDWSNLEECAELPPDMLDDLLCEEEGAFFARWQRETNAELFALHDRAQHDLEAVEHRMAAIQRQADREIADLQRRRRRPDATPDDRVALNQLIADIEADSDAAVADAMARRALLRREIDAAEEALWNREDVLIEVEPLWCVHWSTLSARRGVRQRVRRGGWREAAGANLAPAEKAHGILECATRRAHVAFASLPTGVSLHTATDGEPFEMVGFLPHAGRQKTPVLQAGVRNDRPVGDLGPVDGSASISAAPFAGRAVVHPQVEAATASHSSLADLRAPPSGNISSPATRYSPIGKDGVAEPNHDPLLKVRAERAAVQRHLSEVIERGAKFRPGSPKFRRNREDQAAWRARLSVLDKMLGDTASPPPPAQPRVAPAPAARSPLADLEADRAILAAELAAHEKRGAAPADGRRRFILYAARRADIVARLARLDARLAHVRATIRTPA